MSEWKNQDFSQLTVLELRKVAKAMGVQLGAGISKAGIVEKLDRARNAKYSDIPAVPMDFTPIPKSDDKQESPVEKAEVPAAVKDEKPSESPAPANKQPVPSAAKPETAAPAGAAPAVAAPAGAASKPEAEKPAAPAQPASDARPAISGFRPAYQAPATPPRFGSKPAYQASSNSFGNRPARPQGNDFARPARPVNYTRFGPAAQADSTNDRSYDAPRTASSWADRRPTYGNDLPDRRSAYGSDVPDRRPAFDALTPCYPHEHITLEVEGGSNEFLDMRLIDLVAPIGFGQRGLIHCPPAVDKAHLLSSIANAASICHPDAVVMTLLLGGTPEDATLYRDHTHGEVIASTFDQTPENHLRITDMVLERAERLVEMKKNVILLVDSLTYLSKVYTTAAVQQGRQTIGMVNPVSLQKAKKLFGAARCLREGGSLTIFAVMNIETGSRVDDSIAEDLKGTANMELVLDTAAARAGIYPPVNLLLSGTKRAELIASKEQLDGIKLIHEMLGSLRAVDMIPQLLSMLEKTTNNEDLLVRIKDWAALMKQ